MNRFWTLITLACAAMSGVGSTAVADLVNVSSIGTVNLSPNSQSSAVTISIYDANTASPTSLVAWSLGLQIVPLGITTGTVTIDSSVTYPISGNIFSSPNPAGAPQTTPDSPNTGDLTVGAASNGFVPVTVAGGGQNLVTLKFNASAGATGDFALRLVDDGTPAYTYWTDGSFNDNPFLFNNTAISSAAQIGSIHINSTAAVPEPSSMALTASLLAFAGWRARRKKRNATAMSPNVNVAPNAVS
jgi:hypothetical protein